MKAVTIFSLTARAIWIENVFSSKFLAQKIMFLKPWIFFLLKILEPCPKADQKFSTRLSDEEKDSDSEMIRSIWN